MFIKLYSRVTFRRTMAHSTMGFVNCTLNPEVLTTTDESKSMDYYDRMEKYSLTYNGDQSKFDRAVGVLRALATGDGNHIWSGEDRNIFINGVLPLYNGEVFLKLKTAVFKGLEPNQILMILTWWWVIDVPSCYYFVDTRRHWFMDSRSIKAMSVEHLEQVKLVVFDGDLSKMIEIAFEVPPSERIMMRIMTASELKISFFFGRGVPFKYLENMIRYMDAPDLLVDSLVRLIDTPVVSGAVQDMLFRRFFNTSGKYRLQSRAELLSLIKQVYTEGRKPPPESWTVTLFVSTLCHAWSDNLIDVESGETILETPFCTDCNNDYYGGNDRPCDCEEKFHLGVCDFFMERGVKIPSSFWRKVAYHNLYHLPHYLHINRPHGFNLDIDAGCVRNMIEFDSTAFAQFLVQYQYNQSTEIHDEIQLSCGMMSSQMKAILKPGSKKRQREHLEECQSLLDENNKDMPEGFYIEMCKLFKSGYA